MPRCFLTGIEIELQESWLLDRGAGKKAIRRLRERLAAVERLVSQLSALDEVSVFDRRSRSDKVRQERRLICSGVAAALSASHPEFPLLISWKTFAGRRPPVFPKPTETSPPIPKKQPGQTRNGTTASGGEMHGGKSVAILGPVDTASEDGHAARVE